MNITRFSDFTNNGAYARCDPSERGIKIKARVVIMRGCDVLLEQRFDAGGSPYFRPLGGNVEFGESGQETVMREFHEETRLHLHGIRYLGCIEDIGQSRHESWHEVCLLYHAQIMESEVYGVETLAIQEDDGRKFIARWISFGELSDCGEFDNAPYPAENPRDGKAAFDKVCIRPAGLLRWIEKGILGR